jgi:hypothetical protein
MIRFGFVAAPYCVNVTVVQEIELFFFLHGPIYIGGRGGNLELLKEGKLRE